MAEGGNQGSRSPGASASLKSSEQSVSQGPTLEELRNKLAPHLGEIVTWNGKSLRIRQEMRHGKQFGKGRYFLDDPDNPTHDPLQRNDYLTAQEALDLLEKKNKESSEE